MIINRNINNSSEYKQAVKMSSGPSMLGKFWLITYNVILCAGWSKIGFNIYSSLKQTGDYSQIHKSTLDDLKIFQSLAVFEIIHCMIGLVKSSALTTFQQVFSRVFMLWGLMVPIENVLIGSGYGLSLIAWTITEIIRYSFYAFNLIGYKPAILTYLRYTLFIVLYPMGVTGELLCVFNGLPDIRSKKLFYIEMPNKWNLSFNYFYCCLAVTSLYPILFPKLYGHMFKLRGKILGKKKSE